MQLMHVCLQKIFVYSLFWYFFVYFFVYFRCFISWSSPLPLHCLIDLLNSYIQTFPIIYVLKWYILYCLIYFGFFECLYMHLIWQRKQEITRLRELKVELTLSPRAWGSRFSMSSLVYSLKRLINYCCRICTILCTILKKTSVHRSTL